MVYQLFLNKKIYYINSDEKCYPTYMSKLILSDNIPISYFCGDKKISRNFWRYKIMPLNL